MGSCGPPGTLEVTVEKQEGFPRTQEIQPRALFLDVSFCPCHVASTSVAVWARTSARTGYRRQLTASFLRTADRRRRRTRRWPEEYRPESIEMGISFLSIIIGLLSLRATFRSEVKEATNSMPMDSGEAGSAKATGRT